MPQEPKRSHPGFTLIELLLVMAILGVLTGMLLPVFSTVREKARTTRCLSNQRQVAQAMLIYAQDYDETLPFFGDQWPEPRIFWTDLLKPYQRDERVLHCPSWPTGGKYRDRRGRLVAGEFGFGVNYGALFRYVHLRGEPYREPTRLVRIDNPSDVMLLTDSQGSRYVYTPLIWHLTVDWDRDGLRDSHAGALWGDGPYNRGDPLRHTAGANCTFLDGHTRWIDSRSWLTNQKDIWGSRLPIE